MYDLVDLSVERLANSGRFLLWAVRGWTLAVTQGRCPPQALIRGFAAVDASPALPDFHVALALLASSARYRLIFAPMVCARINEDEAILIALWRDIAANRTAAARMTLDLLTKTRTTGPVAAAMTNTAGKLRAVELDLANPLSLSPTLSGKTS